MKIVFVIIALFTVRFAAAQDVTGIWRGSFNSSQKVFDMFNIEDKYKCEVQIDQLNNALNGVTYSYKSTVFYGKAVASGSVNAKTGEVTFKELKTVELRMETEGVACIMTYNLKYTKNGDEEFLEGTFESVNEKNLTDCGKGTVFLRKVVTSDFHKEPFLVKRSIEQQQREMLAMKTGKSKPAGPRTSTSPRTLTLKSRPGGPVATNKNSSPLKSTPGIKPPVTAKATPPKATPKRPDSTAVAGNSPLKTKPAVRKPPVAKPGIQKPSIDKSIPDVASVDTTARAVPEAKKPLTVIVPKALASRENELVKVINVGSREVVINIYDNGTIDHDTISVYFDQKLVVSKQMLTTKPITVKFTIDDDNATHELVMVAENLGDIPPNTSLMVVKAGEQNIEVRITSTESKNAVVAFRYKKPA